MLAYKLLSASVFSGVALRVAKILFEEVSLNEALLVKSIKEEPGTPSANVVLTSPPVEVVEVLTDGMYPRPIKSVSAVVVRVVIGFPASKLDFVKLLPFVSL